MCHGIFGTVAVLLFFISCCDSIGIDDKLDFDDANHPSLRSHNKAQRYSYTLPVKHKNVVTRVESSDGFENLGVVCAPGGCNATKSTSDSGNSVKTDVVVHIETKIESDENKTTLVGDTPDVPVVIGYKGAKLDSTSEDHPRFVFTPSSEPQSPYKPRYHSSGASFSSQSGTTNYGYFPQPGYAQNEATFNAPDMSLYGRAYSVDTQYYAPAPETFVDPSLIATNRRVYSGTYGYPLQGDTSFDMDSQVNINIKTSPPITLDVADIPQINMVDTKYTANGIQLTIPHFDPSHHNHHFGENPPPQYIYSNKKPSSFNPVEFKTMKSTWTPSTWFKKETSHRHTNTPIGESVKCVCQNGHVQPGLRWYPDSNRRVSSVSGLDFINKNNDPGSQINDKLAPLD
ncbi:hypothetical protein JTB14_004371 [Gonioctena quinquepunctata]|nr:hypothetical protein JTB14_004371 [Gonioctena quinquepunctata]